MTAPLSDHTYSGCDVAFCQSIAQVDKPVRDKIKRGESVDLVKLLPGGAIIKKYLCKFIFCKKKGGDKEIRANMVELNFLCPIDVLVML